MNNRLNKYGFTLVELLVAVALIAAILCMVYGSYVATSKSAQTCKAMVAASEQGRRTLEQMARQIRCSYAGTVDDHSETEPVEAGSKQSGIILEDSFSYFNGNSLAPRGEILHLVTTNRLLGEKQPADGLFEVTYKFDKRESLLSLSQREFIGTAKKTQARSFQPVAENVKSIELKFFDGEKWLRSWEFKDKKQLPYAVRIELDCEDENHRQYHYATVEHVSCQMNRERIQTEKLVSVNN